MKTQLTTAATALAVLLTGGLSFGQEIAPPAGGVPTSPAPLGAPPVLPGPETIPPSAPPESAVEVQLKTQDYKTDWRQAGENVDGLGSRLRSHIVRIGEDNSIRGRIAVIESATGDLTSVRKIRVRFVRKGKIKAVVTPNADGSFAVYDLEPGVYSMIAAGDDAFLAWSVNVQPKKSDIAKMPEPLRIKFKPQEAKASINVQAAAVPPTNFVPLKSLLNGYLPEASSLLYLEADDIPEGMIPPPPEDARKGTSLRHHQVRLTRDGKLRGRIRRLQQDSGRDLRIRQLNVFLLRGNKTVDQVEVATNGTFVFDGVPPEVYSLVAAGRDGFLAFSIDVLNPDQTGRSEKQFHTVSYQEGGIADELAIDVALVPPQDLNATNCNEFTDQFPVDAAGFPIVDGGVAPMGPANMAPMTGGVPISGGPVGGASVASGGGSGLGIILSAGAGVGVASLIDDDDDGRRVQSSPADPGN